MLTNTTEIPGKRLLCLLLLPLVLQWRSGSGILANSVTWGHVNKYASVLYTEDIYLSQQMPHRDVIYGLQNVSQALGYRITALHVEDLTADGRGGEAQVMKGGIGQHYVVIRFQRPESETVDGVAHLNLAIYGLDL